MQTEELLHMVWKHRLLSLKELTTVNGHPLEVLDPGLYNSDAGPDFINAKVRIGRTVWVGNVEMHVKSGDWFLHKHEQNPQYDTVILHVVLEDQCQVFNSKGEVIPQFVMEIPDYLQKRYNNLKVSKELIPCRSVFPLLKPIEVHSWMERLLVERMEERYKLIKQYFEFSKYNWTSTFFLLLARALGFGKNADIFEEWARKLPFSCLIKYSTSQKELDALLFGSAGFLTEAFLNNYFPNQNDPVVMYLRLLQKEYVYLSHKFGLQQMDYTRWRFLRTRPLNFPYVRLAQFSALYQLLCYKVDDILEGTLDFKEFVDNSGQKRLRFSHQSMELLLINCIIPFIFAKGKFYGQDQYIRYAIDYLNSLKSENNGIIRTWLESGMTVKNAAESQALLYLQKNYCDKKDCLRCRFGIKYLKQNDR